MRGVSRDSLAAGQERLERAVRAPGVAAAVGEDLFGITGVLAGNAGVRRAFTDPSRDADAKAALATRLFAAQVRSTSLDLVTGLVRSRWAAAADLVDATESLAVSATLADAEQAGRLDDVEDELFRFSRTVAGDMGLRDALSARTQGADRKARLVATLLAGRAAPQTGRLAVQAATLPRGRRTEQVLESFVDAAAQRRRQLVAQVVSAAPLGTDQRERLAAALRRIYGRDIRVNLDIDPDVVGGLRVQVGGEVLDGTVKSRLDEAGRRLAG